MNSGTSTIAFGWSTWDSHIADSEYDSDPDRSLAYSGMVRGASRLIGLGALRDVGYHIELRLWSDSSAAIGSSVVDASLGNTAVKDKKLVANIVLGKLDMSDM